MEKRILHQFIDNIALYVWWKDLDSIFLGCNKNIANYLGLKHPKEIIGKTDFDILENREEAEFVRKVDQEIISSGRPQLNFEEYLTMSNIGKRWLSTSKIPWRDSDNKIIGIIGWFNDITEFKEMQIKIGEKNESLLKYSMQLKEANKNLELANVELEQFTYAASHDLKSPIRNMINFISLLKRKEENNFGEESANYIDIVDKSANRMIRIVDDILLYAKTSARRMVSEYVDINKIVHEKLLDLQSEIEAKSVELTLNLPPNPIIAFPHLIGLVFCNLISNGIKFNQSQNPIIECNYSEGKDFWHFSVEDNGIGFDLKFAEEIFKPFKRLVGETIEGSGLGLSICKRVVTLHGGEIYVEKNEKGNTVFKFSISKSL